MAGRRTRGGKVLTGFVMAAPFLLGAALVPGMAAGEEQPSGQRPTSGHHSGDHSGRDHMPAGMKDDLAQVRKATARFHRVDEAIAAGYELGWVNGANVRIVAGCVAHPSLGAMGYHYFNAALMADDTVELRRPEVLVYAPDGDGGLDLVAVEWVARSMDSNPPGVSKAPSMLGMDMHILVPPPGPAFYLMHAWVWAENPSGIFGDWNPDVSCS
jgi:hypothetical protein